MAAAANWPTSKYQCEFLHAIARLILKAEELGYAMNQGRGYETEAANKANGGKKNSLHLMKLAQDLNLYKDGKFLGRSEDHKPLGEWWKAQGPQYAWGGDWGDGNHYSFKFGGMK